MAEKDQNTNDNQDLSAKVKNWVEKQGYSLEMRVAKKFQENGFTVSQFEHFIDQESHTVRPVDVVASFAKDIANTRIVIKLYIECKYSEKDKPWVIVVTPDKFDKFSFFSRVLKGNHPSNWKNLDTLQGRAVGKIIQAMGASYLSSVFAIKNPGYVIAESMTNSKDHAYEAIIQISKGVEAHDTEAEETYKYALQSFDDAINRGNTPNLPLYISIAIPIVAINGQLFESSLADNNEIKVTEIESGTVFVPYRRKETSSNNIIFLSPVTVVTEKFLETFVFSVKQGIQTMLNQSEAIEDLIKFENSKFSNSLLDELEF